MRGVSFFLLCFLSSTLQNISFTGPAETFGGICEAKRCLVKPKPHKLEYAALVMLMLFEYRISFVCPPLSVNYLSEIFPIHLLPHRGKSHTDANCTTPFKINFSRPLTYAHSVRYVKNNQQNKRGSVPSAWQYLSRATCWPTRCCTQQRSVAARSILSETVFSKGVACP